MTDNAAALAGRIENVRTHIGSVPDTQVAVIARLDELGDIARDLRALAAPPAPDRVETAAQVLHNRRHRFGTAPTCGACRDDVAAVAAVLTPTSETGETR